ncbi:hypothetical protein ACU4GD_43485 [Cupriavidus basilensis]
MKVARAVGGQRHERLSARKLRQPELLESARAVADGNVVNIEAVGIALKRALGKAGIRTKEVVLGVAVDADRIADRRPAGQPVRG